MTNKKEKCPKCGKETIKTGKYWKKCWECNWSWEYRNKNQVGFLR